MQDIQRVGKLASLSYNEIIRRYVDTILINAQSHISSRGAPRGRLDGDFHQEFYPIPNLWVVLCVCDITLT